MVTIIHTCKVRFCFRCQVRLGEFVKEIKESPNSVNYTAMANILVVHCQSQGSVSGLIVYVPNFPSPRSSYSVHSFAMGQCFRFISWKKNVAPMFWISHSHSSMCSIS
jgi:hypothetical protein